MQIINQKYHNLSSYSEEFLKNSPYPYLILDNFLDENFYKFLNNENEKINYQNGKSFTNELEKNN